MNKIHVPLGLRIPEQTTLSRESFLLDPKDTEAWVIGLPMANISETSRQVFKAIVEFNRIKIPSLVRNKVAEHFREPVAYVAKYLEKYFIDVSFPMSAKSQKVAVFTREIYSELAIAYKIAIEDMLSEDRDHFDQKMLIISIQRAMHYLAYVLLQSALTYVHFPETIWNEIHLLFSFANRFNFDRLKVKDRDKMEADPVTVRDLYKRILLFSLSAPYQLRQRDTLKIFSNLRDWSDYAHLEEDIIQIDNHECFVVVPHEDSPPLHLSLCEDSLNEKTLIIDNRELIEKLREENDKSSSDGRELTDAPLTGSSNMLLRHLIYSWSSAPQRKFVRTKLHFELQIAIGLSAIHSLLITNALRMDSEADTARNIGDMDWLDEQLNTNRLMQYGLHSKQGDFSISEIPAHLKREHDRHGFEEFDPGSTDQNIVQGEPICDPGSISMPNHEIFTLHTMNESAGGFCIGWQGQNAPGVRIWELIGIQSANNPTQFGVGIARWMKYIPNHGLQLGMQMVSPNVIAVDVKLDNKFDSELQQCLLLPEIQSVGQASSLITPTMHNRIGSLVRIEDGQSVHKARLTCLLEATGAFHHYKFDYLDNGYIEKDQDLKGILTDGHHYSASPE